VRRARLSGAPLIEGEALVVLVLLAVSAAVLVAVGLDLARV
jgi:hypothetical protein